MRIGTFHDALHAHLFLEGLQPRLKLVDLQTGLIDDTTDFLPLLHLLPENVFILLNDLLLAVCLPELFEGDSLVQ